jgi:uncharacterized alkaline shock family protein YloU
LVVAKLAAHAARQTYGVVDMKSTAMRKMTDLFHGTEGVEARVRDGAAYIRLHVIMERGVNVAQVTAILRSQVSYEITRGTGLTVDDVIVKVEDLRE